MVEFLKPIQEKRKELEEQKIVDQILKEGTQKAQEKAKETMKKIKESMKIDYFDEISK